jgi:hypothetical protein
MSVARYWDEVVDTTPRHPNEFDQRRIARAIQDRKRYKYVSPVVVPQENGYLIRSACCSRNVDPDGGEIDVALLRWSESPAGWALYRKDHRTGIWVRDGRFARLPELFDRLNTDPDRLFWQ